MRSRRILSGSLLVAVLALSAGRAKADAARTALDRTLPATAFDNVPLGDALETLRDVSGANIHVNWRAIEAVHVSKDTPINVRLRAVPLRKTLALLLSETGAGDLLTFYNDGGVIEITTREIADRQMFTRVYPVADLLLEVPDFEAPKGNTSNSSSSGSRTVGGSGSSGSGSSSSVFGSSGSATSDVKDQKTKVERGKELIELITQTIQPDVWRDNGGTASIRIYNDNLVITAPRGVHEALGGPVD